MSNRFGRRAQGPPTAQGPQDQYGPAQESQEQYGPRPPQGTQQEQYAGRQQGAQQEQYVPRPSPGYEAMREPGQRMGREAAAPAGRAWHGHGGGLLMLTGILAFLEGLAHLLTRAFFIVLPHYAYNWTVTGWGITHLVLGAVMFLAGVVALTGLLAARVFGAVVAVLTAIAFFMYVPFSPVWSIIIVALCAASVWALLMPHRRPF